MYKIVEPPEPFNCAGILVEPKVSLINTETNQEFFVAVRDNAYVIFTRFKKDTDWSIARAWFDLQFVEFLRLLPEKTEDLGTLNEPYYKEIFEVWQTNDTTVDVPALTDDLAENIINLYDEKKEGR